MDEVISEIKELAPKERLVLDWVKANKQPVTAQDVATHFGISTQYAGRMCNKMLGLGLLGKPTGKPVGKAKRYRYLKSEVSVPKAVYSYASAKPKAKNRRNNSQNTRRTPARYELTATDLLDLLRVWQNKRWEPKVTASATNVPAALARLVELAVEASYGSNIEQEEIGEVRLTVSQFKDDLEHMLRIVNGLLAIPGLWSSKNSASIILEANSDVSYLKYLAFRVRESN